MNPPAAAIAETMAGLRGTPGAGSALPSVKRLDLEDEP